MIFTFFLLEMFMNKNFKLALCLLLYDINVFDVKQSRSQSPWGFIPIPPESPR